MKPKYELMAPAGNFPMLSAAINAGADAVYFGLNEFSMRATSKNFSISDLDEIRALCDGSERKVKLYLTLNTIIYDEELEKLEDIIKQVKNKIDAIICWDQAVISLCRQHELPFFISTQASVANSSAADYYKSLGAQRIVLARELNLEQIKKISEIIEVEAFVHGAMCVAVSGRCFMSQFVYNKSGNRGECYQNCRRSYTITDDAGHELQLENSQVLSAKDLCMLPHIEFMKKAGVTSFKIEGRGRDARYVDIVTRTYRKALDKPLSQDEIDNEMVELKKVFNRDFSTGFYLGHPVDSDFSPVDNNAATEIKVGLGKVINYYPKNEVASILLTDELNPGDQIVVIGNKTGIVTAVVDTMEIENQPVEKAEKGQMVGIKIARVRENDKVFKVIGKK